MPSNRTFLEDLGCTTDSVSPSFSESRPFASGRQQLNCRLGRNYKIMRAQTIDVRQGNRKDAGPKDAVGRAVLGVGCQIEKFLAPIESGNLGGLLSWVVGIVW